MVKNLSLVPNVVQRSTQDLGPFVSSNHVALNHILAPILDRPRPAFSLSLPHNRPTPLPKTLFLPPRDMARLSGPARFPVAFRVCLAGL